ncbi:TPA: hypothetical protein ACTYSM_005472 [Klebsiella pneumoniae]|uniref:hypothetical protein n=1 Tax=Klebsiella pneumoniae TaxID=573 RepID=UPI001E60ECF0|nr:hypothetical protein [Klebsiella pneumoniae]OKL91474.1 hypothetical protein AM330_005602 [Klebsiella pneumoniae]
MFNTDSLAWKWHIPELARQIYPWVSWLYQEYYGLAGAFLVIGLFSVWLNFGPDGCVLWG